MLFFLLILFIHFFLEGGGGGDSNPLQRFQSALTIPCGAFPLTTLGHPTDQSLTLITYSTYTYSVDLGHYIDTGTEVKRPILLSLNPEHTCKSTHCQSYIPLPNT